MLRITIEEKQNAVVLRLEGQLIGPWVADVEQCWRNVFATPRPTIGASGSQRRPFCRYGGRSTAEPHA